MPDDQVGVYFIPSNRAARILSRATEIPRRIAAVSTRDTEFARARKEKRKLVDVNWDEIARQLEHKIHWKARCAGVPAAWRTATILDLLSGWVVVKQEELEFTARLSFPGSQRQVRRIITAKESGANDGT